MLLLSSTAGFSFVAPSSQQLHERATGTMSTLFSSRPPQEESFGEAAERFRLAARFGNFDAVRELYGRHGSVIVNVSCDQKWTALHWATVRGRVEVVKYLVETCEADIQIANRYGRTAMHYAIYSGKLEIVQYLVESAGADIHVVDNYGFTSLHCASEEASLEIVQYLVETAGANVHAMEKTGRTPVQNACKYGCL
jgi:ankyrin repeat protein